MKSYSLHSMWLVTSAERVTQNHAQYQEYALTDLKIKINLNKEDRRSVLLHVQYVGDIGDIPYLSLFLVYVKNQTTPAGGAVGAY